MNLSSKIVAVIQNGKTTKIVAKMVKTKLYDGLFNSSNITQNGKIYDGLFNFPKYYCNQKFGSSDHELPIFWVNT